MSTALVWFRRDLRLTDNPALSAALASADTVVPVYVHAPAEEGDWAPGAASRWWLHRSLAALADSLRELGSPLVIRRGPTAEALTQLAAETGASTVHHGALYEPLIAGRDAAVAESLTGQGLHVEAHDGHLLFPPGSVLTGAGTPFKVFTPFWRACQPRLDELAPPAAAPRKLRRLARDLGSLALDDLGLQPRVAWDDGLRAAWQPGESGALSALEQFAGDAIRDYSTGRDRPDLAGTSRLSPHLHFGELSPRQALVAIRSQARSAGAAAWLREVGWREFAHHLLHHFPNTPDAPLDERFAKLAWREDAAQLAAWQQGRTGYPIVDAGLRELWHTGWMHNRVRMIVASLLTKNLFMHWRVGARWFWDTLVDADLANNTLGWQWVAGCGADASPYYRIFNPVLQAKKFDVGRAYIRRWVPELAVLPDRWIHRPWEAPAHVLAAAGVELGRDYPIPIVELGQSRADALERFERLKRGRD